MGGFLVGRFLAVGVCLALVGGCQFVPVVSEAEPEVGGEALGDFRVEVLAAVAELAVAQAELKAAQAEAARVQALGLAELRRVILRQEEGGAFLGRQLAFQVEQLGDLLAPGFKSGVEQAVVTGDGKLLLGEQEWVLLVREGLVLPARVDSGAQTSSLHGVNLLVFERDGLPWVRFDTAFEREGAVVEVAGIEAPLVRRVSVAQAAGFEERLVVGLVMQLGALRQVVEFTLTDRGHLAFPVLLGRRFFMDIAVIDVSQSYVQGLPEVVDLRGDGGVDLEGAPVDGDAVPLIIKEGGL